MSMASGDASNSHTLLSLNLDEHSESIRKEVSKRILRMPRVEGLVVNKQNKLLVFIVVVIIVDLILVVMLLV